MVMRLGFVGVGHWAQKLATAFRECGAEVAAYDRNGSGDAPGFGQRMDWSSMVSLGSIDAIIACAPPDVTTEVALACAKAGKRCVATKPLMWSEWPEFAEWPMFKTMRERKTGAWATDAERSDPGVQERFTRKKNSELLYVDLWRLYSPAWLAMKEELRDKKIDRIDVAFCGNGPFRSFNGALDYGPHALAFVFDLLGTTKLRQLDTDGIDWLKADPRDCAKRGVLWVGRFEANGTEIEVRIGNGAKTSQRWVSPTLASDDDANFCSWSEPSDDHPRHQKHVFNVVVNGIGLPMMEHDKSYALRRFCRAFMAGESSRTLEYSIAAQSVLERIVG